MAAATNGHEAVVRALVAAGAVADKATTTGWTAQAWAAAGGHQAGVQKLLAATSGHSNSQPSLLEEMLEGGLVPLPKQAVNRPNHALHGCPP